MTDRYYTVTVVLERDYREDDAQPILDAIQHIKGVLSVKGNVANPDIWAMETRAKSELAAKLWDVLK